MAKKRGIGGIREDLGFYVRSRMEANVIRYYEWLKTTGNLHDWKYEEDEFEFPVKRGTRFYKPDIKIWETPESKPYYVEVKGYLDPKSKTQLKRMAKYYPEVEVRLLQAKEYAAIKKWQKVIPHWEG